MSKSTNGVTGYREEVLQHLRKIAKSANKMELDENIKLLKESKAWKSSVQLQKYFTEFWGLHLQVFQSKQIYHFLLCQPYYRNSWLLFKAALDFTGWKLQNSLFKDFRKCKKILPCL